MFATNTQEQTDQEFPGNVFLETGSLQYIHRSDFHWGKYRGGRSLLDGVVIGKQHKHICSDLS